jgi:hypothetical protein
MQKEKARPAETDDSEEQQIRNMMYAVARTTVANETKSKAARPPLPLKMRKPWRR